MFILGMKIVTPWINSNTFGAGHLCNFLGMTYINLSVGNVISFLVVMNTFYYWVSRVELELTVSVSNYL